MGWRRRSLGRGGAGQGCGQGSPAGQRVCMHVPCRLHGMHVPCRTLEAVRLAVLQRLLAMGPAEAVAALRVLVLAQAGAGQRGEPRRQLQAAPPGLRVAGHARHRQRAQPAQPERLEGAACEGVMRPCCLTSVSGLPFRCPRRRHPLAAAAPLLSRPAATSGFYQCSLSRAGEETQDLFPDPAVALPQKREKPKTDTQLKYTVCSMQCCCQFQHTVSQYAVLLLMEEKEANACSHQSRFDCCLHLLQDVLRDVEDALRGLPAHLALARLRIVPAHSTGTTSASCHQGVAEHGCWQSQQRKSLLQVAVRYSDRPLWEPLPGPAPHLSAQLSQ